ncbi:MAG: acid resistance repetitive basic protein Asr [Enterobacter sp.]
MKKVLALVVAAAMGLSSAAFAAETTATQRLRHPPLLRPKRFTIKNITKRLNQRQNRKRRPRKSTTKKRQNLR